MNSVDGRARELDSDPSLRMPLADGTTVGPYRILTLIASGGMGDVYRARDERLGREVALKVLPTGLTDDRERVERFAQEAKSASALNHPHIVAIYEIGQARPQSVVLPIAGKRAEEIHYIAMELVEGETLREFLTAAPPFAPSLARRLEVLAQTAEGLGKAHAAGIVHRDLKPDNVMVSSEGWAKVVDFGLAKLVEPAHGWNPLGADSPTMRAITQQGELIGTAGYMSPEQILGKAIDQRSDIFSFGCIVYEAVRGTRPFDGESFVDTLHEVLHATPPPLEHPELQRIVNKCLVKDREQRYQSIRDVALDLRAAAAVPAELPVAARPRWRPIAAAAALLIALTGGGAWLLARHPPAGVPPVAAAAQPLLQRLTTNGHVGHLAVSPDARFAAFTVHDDETGDALWLQQLATGSHVTVIPGTTRGSYVGVSFSADGNHILPVRYDGTIYGAVTEMPLLGGSGAKLADDADTAAAASPDGRQLAFVRNVLDKGESRLIVALRDGTRQRVMATFPLQKHAVAPVWSPQGHALAVAYGANLLTIAAATGEKHAVTTAAGTISGLAWEASGKALLISSLEERAAGHFQLLRVDAATGAATHVTADSDDYVEPQAAGTSIAAVQVKHQATLWSVLWPGVPGAAAAQLTRGLGTSDGLYGLTSTADHRIVYSSNAGGAIDLWMAREDGAEARQLTADDRIEYQPLVTADSKAVVYISRAPRESRLMRLPLDGGQARQLAAAPSIYDFALTPDGKRAVYAAGDEGAAEASKRSSLLSVSLEGGAPAVITPTGLLLRSLRMTPDGSALIFSALQNDALQVFRVPAGGGRVTRLTSERSEDAVVSPDGRRIACSVGYEDFGTKLAILAAADGHTLQTLDLEGRLYRWTPDGQSIVFVKRGKQENLYVQSLAGGPARPLTSFTDGTIAGFEWSPDGKRIVLTHYVQTRDVVLLGG
jgi:Tol biopolymer transport system component